MNQLLDQDGRFKSGCKMQMHEPYSGITMDTEKERKVLDRVTTHQLIILENPPQMPIEEIKIKAA